MTDISGLRKNSNELRAIRAIYGSKEGSFWQSLFVLSSLRHQNGLRIYTSQPARPRLLFSRETDWIAWPSSKYLQLLQILSIRSKYYLTLICECDHWTYNANVNGSPHKLFVLQCCYLPVLRYKNVQCPVNNVDNANIVIALLIWSCITSGRL